MPSILVSEEDFKRMQRLAEPLVDTPATLITKLLDAFEVSDSAKAHAFVPNSGVKLYAFDAPPPLVHVKFISGVIGTREPKKANWDSMVSLCLEMLREQGLDTDLLATITDLNVVGGKKVDEGYKYLPELAISYQGVSAAHAAKVIVNSARYMGLHAYVDFIWREKDEAFAPGQVGALTYALEN